MKYSEFCHWLNGFFELNEPKTINEPQVELIKKHIEMVMVHEQGAVPFCSFLKGYLKISGVKEINEEQTQLIKDELNATFKNGFTLSTSNEKPSKIPGFPNNPPQMRC